VNIKKYFSLFNIKNHVLDVIETFNIDSQSLLTSQEKKEAGMNLISRVSKLSADISLQPLPFADTLIITPIQVSLVMKISQIYGKTLDKKVTQEVVATIIKSIAATTLARTALKFIPFVGVPVCFAISYITTNSIGLTAIRVFENHEKLDLDQVKETFEKEFNKTLPVNVVISKSLSAPTEEIKPLARKPKGSDLKAVHEETRKTVLYLPSDN